MFVQVYTLFFRKILLIMPLNFFSQHHSTGISLQISINCRDGLLLLSAANLWDKFPSFVKIYLPLQGNPHFPANSLQITDFAQKCCCYKRRLDQVLVLNRYSMFPWKYCHWKQCFLFKLAAITSFISPLTGAHLSPFSSCHVRQTVSVAAASVSGRFAPTAGLVSQPPIGSCGQELLTVDLPHLDTPTTGLGALKGGRRR